MASTTTRLTPAQFDEQFGRSERSYEYWYGEAIPKSMPTVVHGLLQSIIAQLLKQAGFSSASEVELHFDPDAHLRPDLIAAKTKLRGTYLTQPTEVVVEIVSEDEPYSHLKEKCRKYQAWGFARIFVVDPTDRSVAEWTGALVETQDLAGISAACIWQELDQQYFSEGGTH